MNTIIEKIRAEVERLYDEANNYDDSRHYLGEVSSFLSDLEKECGDFPTTDEEMKQFLATHPKVEVPEKYKTPDWIFEKSEKPTIPESEGEAISWKPTENDLMMLEHIIGQYEIGNKNCKTMGYLPRVEELSFLKKVLSKWKN